MSKINPVMVGYGEAKVGKTRSLVLGCPTWLYLCHNRESVLSQFRAIGFQTPNREKMCIDIGGNLPRLVEEVKRASGKVQGIAIDDFSLILEQWTSASAGMGSVWDVYRRMGMIITTQLWPAMQAAGCPVIITMHADGPDGKGNPGRPLLPGWKAPKRFASLPSFVARVQYEEDRKPWPYFYSTAPTRDWEVGDRYDVAPLQCPLNLGEVLRAAEFDVTFPKSIPWIENTVEEVSEKILIAIREDESERSVLLEEARKISQDHKPENEKHIIWALTCARDRAALKQFRGSSLDRFFDAFN
jgi:hypothetical protein